MSRVLAVSMAFFLGCVVCYSQDAENPVKQIPVPARKAWEKAEKAVARNRESYEDANAKALALLARELEKSNQTVAKSEEIVKQFRDHIASLDAKAIPPAPPPPLKDTFVFNGHRYQIVLETLSWTDAKKACEAKGGYLAVIDKKDEYLALAKILKDYMNANNQQLGNDAVVWLGALRSKETKQWMWADNTKMLFSQWEPHFPLPEQDRDFVFMKMATGTLLNFWDQVLPSAFYLCEWDKVR